MLAAQAVDASLSVAEQQALDAHLATCAECRAIARDLAGQAQFLRHRPRATVPAGLRPLVSTTWQEPARRLEQTIQLAFAVALLLLLLFAIVVIGGGSRLPFSLIAEPAVPDQIVSTNRFGDAPQIVDAWAAQQGRPTGSVSILLFDGQVGTFALGPTPGGAEPVGRVGEASRLYTAAVVLIVADCALAGARNCPLPVETGAFRLDDPIERWLPGSPVGDRTIRQLLAGTSGIAAVSTTISDLRDRVLAQPTGKWDRDAVLDAALAAPVRFAPGERREPVNSEFLLLERVLELATGRTATEWIDAAFIRHLGLRQTVVPGESTVAVAPGRSDRAPLTISTQCSSASSVAPEGWRARAPIWRGLRPRRGARRSSCRRVLSRSRRIWRTVIAIRSVATECVRAPAPDQRLP